MKQILFIILFIFLTSQVTFAQVYKWVDEKGVTHFTDDETQVPAKFRSKSERIETPEEKEETKSEGELAPKRKEEGYRDQLGRGEDYWKGRVEEWRKKLIELKDKLQALRAKYNGLTERYNDSRSLAVRADLRRERDQVKREIDQCNTQIEEARGMLEKKIPEEAELYKARPEWLKQ
jgi:predicted  nucleic acid-binding Zn-ribbon protein